jgi:DNA processing protein
MPLRHWLQLSLTEGIGPILIRRIIDAVGGVEQACEARINLLRNVEGIGGAKATKIHESLRAAGREADAEIERAAQLGIQIICPDDATYPVMLRSIPDPPAVLYMKGTLEDRDLNAVAIVGSRRCSHYGREQSERFAALLAGAGFTVISGGARGVDSAAHRGAMAHPQGRTIAVLGCGLDTIYPPENGPLFDQIAKRGAMISEYPLGTAPLSDNFPRRNRIVSGMSRGVLVIEADERSGALITARQAADDHNRPVFALPGRVDNAMSAGPHKLIRDGATLVTKLEDILDGLGPLPHEAMEPQLWDLRIDDATPEKVLEGSAPAEPAGREPDPPKAEAASLTESQRLILTHLNTEPAAVDQIIERSELPANVVLRELTFLSLKGVVKRIDGQTFARSNNRS